MKKFDDRTKVSINDFMKNMLAAWGWILYEAGMCLFFGFLILSMAGTFIKERIEIVKMAPVYEVAEGIVESVEVHKYYSDTIAGHPPDLIPDKKYSAEISYTDESGIAHQLTVLEVEKKLTVGKVIKIVYNPAEELDADIAYFDVLVWDYVPYHMNTFRWFDIIIFPVCLFITLLHGELLWGTIKECAQKEYKPEEKPNKPHQKKTKKTLTRQQLRARRNLYTLAGCICVPLCIIWHYGYLIGKEKILLSELAVFMTEWPVAWKHIIIAFVCYFPVMIFFGLRAHYENRMLRTTAGI